MMISNALLVKGGMGFFVLGSAGGLYLCYHNGYLFFSEGLEKMLDRAGLSCSFPDKPDNGVDCSIKPGRKIKFGMKLRPDKYYEVDNKSMGTNANLRFYFIKDEKNLGLVKGNEMKNKLVHSLFTLEGGDLTLDGDVKAKEFEGFRGVFGSNKNGVISSVALEKIRESNALIKELTGFPCDLPEGSDASTSDCTLNSENIDQIEFEGKTGKATLSGDNSSISVNISKLATSDPDFPLDYKFTFTSTQETTINLGGKNISLGANIPRDLRIKKTPVPNTKKQALTLEEAWTVKSLGAKVGLECPETVNNGAGECTLKNGNVVNINNGNSEDATKKFKGLSKKDTTGSKIVKFEEKVAGHNQGFKFYTEETNGIALQSSGGDSDSDDKKIAHKGDDANPVSYQILKDGDEWYLTKVTNGGAAA